VIRDETALRRVPELEFRLDDSLKRDAALDEAIRAGLADRGDDPRDDEAREDGEHSEIIDADGTRESPETSGRKRTFDETAGDGPEPSEEPS
jgi:hypothetical protein